MANRKGTVGSRGPYAEKLHTDDYVRIKSPEDIHPDGAQYLVEAIIQKAANDWRTCSGALKRRPITVTTRGDLLLKTKRDCEEFFKSKYFAALTGLDGEQVLASLRKELDDNYDTHKIKQKGDEAR